MLRPSVQQGCRNFGARSVRERKRREEQQVCEPEGDNGPRTQLAVFWDILPTIWAAVHMEKARVEVRLGVNSLDQ